MPLSKIKIAGNAYDAWATKPDVEEAKKNIKGADSKKTFDGIYNIVGCDFQGNYELAYDDGDYRIINHTQLEIPDVVEEGTIIRASDLEDANLILIKRVNPTILANVNGNASDGYRLLDNFVQEVIIIEKDKNYICTGTIGLSTLALRPQDRKTGTLYLWAEYDGDSIHDAKEEILDAVNNIDIDTSTLAQQGDNPDVSLTSVSAEVGTGSDTAAESGTLFAVLKWVKDKVKSIFNLIGSPASGQPSTLFAAIAAGGGGDAQESTSQAILAAVNAIVNAHIINNVSLDGYVFEDGFTPTSAGDILLNKNRLIEMHDDKIIYANSINNLFDSSSKIKIIDLPNLLTGLTNDVRISYGCTTIREVHIPKITGMNGISYMFYNNVNLIDLEFGENITGNIVVRSWSPTNALSAMDTNLLTPEDIAAGFTNNLEKLLYNIREHIAANLPTRTSSTSLTITFSAAVKAAIQADAATLAAFTNKYWNIA